MKDLIVIGAGPAGLTAALYALRANKSVLILEKNGFGGQMTFSPKIENYPGNLIISGNALADQMVEQVLAQGADVELEEVEEIRRQNGCFTVVTDSGEHEARAVIAALGAKHRTLGVPGEEDLIGNGISFCAVCDGAFYAGRDVAVVGGGNSALQEALLLADGCRSVTIVQNLDFLTGEEKLQQAVREKQNIRVLPGTVVTAFSGQGEKIGARVKNASGEEELVFDGIFLAVGLKPDNGVAAPLTALDEAGYVKADERCLTDTPGLFVAGDCRTKQIRQITTATADGATAALAAVRYLDRTE